MLSRGPRSPELPRDASALAVLPATIDTPMNRKFMTNADFSSWTKVGLALALLGLRMGQQMTVVGYTALCFQVDDIASKMLEWAEKRDSRPPSGHLVRVTTHNDITTWTDVGSPFVQLQ